LSALVTFSFQDAIGFDRGAIISYTSMLVAFLLIFFGVRSYRENVAEGKLQFGRAFAVGALIALVSSLCYVATREVVYFKLAPDFMAKYEAHILDRARADGASAETITQKKSELDQFALMYQNPAMNAAITFLEPLPVALIVALVSAGVLSRRRKNVGS